MIKARNAILSVPAADGRIITFSLFFPVLSVNTIIFLGRC